MMTQTPGPGTGVRASEDRYRKYLEFDSVAWGSHCVDCYPGGCPYRVYVRDGKIVREEVAGSFLDESPATHEPDLYPMGCNKGAAWSAQLEAADRLRHPMRRVGERGSGRWERISWDEALDEVADALIEAMEGSGSESIVREGTPEVGIGMGPDRFINLLGGVVLDLNGSINDFSAGHHLTFGKFFPLFVGEGEFFDSDTIVFWHTNPTYTVIPWFHFYCEARYHGTELVLFSPDVSPSHLHVDYHVPVEWGSDPAVALAMCQVIVEEGLVDESFVRTQTDLSLLVRTDTECFLRESDLVEGGREDQFYHLDPARGPVPASRENLLCDYTPALEGTASVHLADGSAVEVRPLMLRLTEMLGDYTPEKVEPIAGTHADTLRLLARKIAGGRTRIIMGMGANKAYHSDLYQRTMNLLLALTGNWGRLGAGINCWAAPQMDGMVVTGAKTQPGAEGAEQVLTMLDLLEESIRTKDPTMSDELVSFELWRGLRLGRQTAPPAFFWYWHCGYEKRWNNPEWNDPQMPRSFDEYFQEALDAGWWAGLARPGPDTPPRVLIECGGNTLRRTRGGRGTLLENLWPKLDKIVTIDFRMSTTALHSDILLPAAQHYEKFAMNIPITTLVLSEPAAAPVGEAKPEWEIFAALCKAVERRAAGRGLETYRRSSTNDVLRYDSLWDAYTLAGAYDSSERVADEVIRDSAYAEILPPGTDLAKVREKGYIRYTKWGRLAMARGQATPWPEQGESFSVFRNHVERGDPYPTLTRRAQFLIEHPWFVEAGEDLPIHKDSPKMGGDHPFRMTTGHNRWSVHAMNMSNPHLIQTHRGAPHAVIHPHDAAAAGIADDEPMRVFNDAGSFVVRAKLSPTQRPGGITVYNGWAPYMFENWTGPNDVEPGMVKYLGFAGGYGHLTYGPMEWQPVPIDRFISVGIEPAS